MCVQQPQIAKACLRYETGTHQLLDFPPRLLLLLLARSSAASLLTMTLLSATTCHMGRVSVLESHIVIVIVIVSACI